MPRAGRSVTRAGGFRLPVSTGSHSKVTHFAARDAALYFVVSDEGKGTLYRTGRDGAVEFAISLGTDRIAGFDLDGSGKAYVAYADSRLVLYDEHGAPIQSVHLESPVTALAIVHGRPTMVGTDQRIHFLDPAERRFTLAAYPGPYRVFAAGTDRLGILDPAYLHLMQLDGAWSSHLPVTSWRPIAAGATADGRVFIATEGVRPGIVSLIDCGYDARPSRAWEYTIPGSFTPQFIGFASGRVYMADAEGSVAYFRALQQSGMPGRPLDSAPQLVSDLEPLYTAVRRTGYRGQVKLRLQLSATGAVDSGAILYPDSLAGVEDVLHAVGALTKIQAPHEERTGTPAAMEFSAEVR